MRFFCPACGTAQTIDDALVPADGSAVECEKCGFGIKLKAPKRPAAAKPVAATETRMPAADRTEPNMPAAAAPEAPPAAPATAARPAARQPAPAPDPVQAAAEEPAAEEEVPPVDAIPEEAPAPAPAPKAAKKKAAPRKAAAKKAAGLPAMPKDIKLPFPGTCRSGDRYRFRDLFYALRAPLDLRKTAAAAAGIFVGTFLMVLIMYLATLTKSQIGMIVGTIVGFVLYFAFMYLGLGVSTRQADREMIEGHRLPLSEGLGFVKDRLVNVVGFPFLFVVGIVAMGVGIAIFQLLARVPYAGPIIYGLLYSVVFVLALVAVLLAVLMVFSTFSYIPAADRFGLLGLFRHLWALVKRNPGRFALHLLVTLSTTVALVWVLKMVVGSAMGMISAVDGLAGGGEYPKILLSMPGGLFAFFALLYKVGMGAGAGMGWQFTIAGWAVFITLVMVFSLVQGFVLTYMQAAGAVNYHLLTQDDEADPPSA